MKGMGSLSEAEGRKISAAASALDLSLSDEEFKKELTVIRDGLQKARERQLEKLPVEVRSRLLSDEFKAKVSGMPKQNDKGWSLMMDGSGNAAYVGPNGEIEEIK